MEQKMRLFLMQIPDHLSQEDYEWLLGLVNSEKKEKLLRKRNCQDAYASLLGELLVRSDAAGVLHRRPLELSLTYNKWGKPYLAASNCYQFNLSHSRQYLLVVCGSQVGEIGCDIQCMIEHNQRAMDSANDAATAAIVFQEKERLRIQDKHSFFQMWSRKESLLKAIGTGFASSPLIYDVSQDRVSVQNDWYYIHEYTELDDYAIAICSRMMLRPELCQITYTQLLQRLELQSLLL